MSARELFQWKSMMKRFLQAGIGESSVLTINEIKQFDVETSSAVRRYKSIAIKVDDPVKGFWGLMKCIGQLFNSALPCFLGVCGTDRYMVLRYNESLLELLEQVYADSQDVFTFYQSGGDVAVSVDIDKTAFDFDSLCVTLHLNENASPSIGDSRISQIQLLLKTKRIGDILEIG